MTAVRGTLEERFWTNVRKPTASNAWVADASHCWEWTASKDGGYGKIGKGGTSRRGLLAHRVAYELVIGPIPEGTELDHLCRNRGCVNPAHLDPVSHKINCQRGVAGAVNAARQRAKTHCPKGHPYDEANTVLRPNGWRGCRECFRAHDRARAHKACPQGHPYGDPPHRGPKGHRYCLTCSRDRVEARWLPR
jgi:hypothetical protein